MKIVFMGTPDFAVPSLDMLVSEGHDVVAVVTQPDKPKGRGNKMSLPPIKEYAIAHGIQVLQPEKVKTEEFVKQIAEIKPDLLVTAAYGKILPKAVLDIPPYGCINVHGSLLPKYRGAAPIQWCIIDGEKVTGITTMFTDEGMDTGDILLKGELEITDNMTAGELHDKMSVLGAQVLNDTLNRLKEGSLERIPQCDSQATYASMITRDTGCIVWDKSAHEVHNLVRGTSPWPGAYTFYKGEKMKIWLTSVVIDEEQSRSMQAGTICTVNKQGIIVACGSGRLLIKEIQMECSRRMSVEDYICGHKMDEGGILG